MENTAYNDPKDEHITNNDTAITNKDGDNNLEKGEQPTEQEKPDSERVETVTPDNENGDPGPPDEEENTSNKGQGPAGENL
ncbi:MAG: hypothetical protein JWQ79_1280 [Mucilaginibacter sp.]|jgi:hypothetical protein|nr:hypothetical protein [Mucilaginibacter sp.]